MKTTLYEIADNYRAFMQMVDAGEIEDMDAISDTLEQIQQEFDTKVDNIACLYKSMSAEADAIEAEAKRLLDRARYKRNVCDRLKTYVSQQMQSIGQTRFENERNRITFRDSASLNITDPNALATALSVADRNDLFTTEQTIKFDKANIRKAIKDGSTFAGCEVVTNKNIQIK